MDRPRESTVSFSVTLSSLMSTVTTFSRRQKAVITEARDMGYIVIGRRSGAVGDDSAGPRSHLASSF